MEPQGNQALNEGNKSQSAGLKETCLFNFNKLNPVASTNTFACCGVSERMGNIISLWIEDSPQVTAESY